MKAKVLVRVDRDEAIEAIRALDELRAALQAHEPRWPKRLRRRYSKARHNLVRAAGWWAHCHGVADMAAED
jgi:hypothetical protein